MMGTWQQAMAATHAAEKAAVTGSSPTKKPVTTATVLRPTPASTTAPRRPAVTVGSGAIAPKTKRATKPAMTAMRCARTAAPTSASWRVAATGSYVMTCSPASRAQRAATTGTVWTAMGAKERLPAGGCGDGVLRRDLEAGDEGYEECDDGNQEVGDGCNASCQNEQCGNGRVDPGEGCDDGNLTHSDACRNDCVAARCGDQIVRTDVVEGQEGYEACDDGNEIDTDACRNNCVRAVCGDQVVRTDLAPGAEGYENCDDGNQVDDDECSNGCVDLRTHRIVKVIGGRARGILCGIWRGLSCAAKRPIMDTVSRNGTTQNTENPVLVPELNGVVHAAVGDAHVCAVLESGAVRCWGANYAGQVGDGTVFHRSVPVAVQGVAGATQISAGAETTCVRQENQTVACWGGNNSGMLGIGNNDQSHVVRQRPCRGSPGCAASTCTTTASALWV